MWVSGGLIISARMRKVWAVDAIRQQIEAGRVPRSVGACLAELCYGLTKRIETVSLRLAEDADDLEDRAFDDWTGLGDALATKRHSVIKLWRFVRPQAEAFEALIAQESDVFSRGEMALLRETTNRARRVLEELDATADRLHAVQDHIELRQATALGRNSYVLSIVAAIFLPLGFLTGLFGINVGGIPGIDAPFAFWVVSAASVLIGVLLYLVFRLLKWF